MRTQASRAMAELLEDEDFQQLITDRLEEDPTFWTGSGKRRTVITVEVDDGHVTLNGTVRTRMDRRRADILVRALGATGGRRAVAGSRSSLARRRAATWTARPGCRISRSRNGCRATSVGIVSRSDRG